MGQAVKSYTQGGEQAVTILIVDDEESIRRSLAGVFHDEGYRTLHASDGEEALRLIQTEKPSLILLDIWMPGMDGIETLQRIKALEPEIPIIMISGHASISTAMTATKLGAHDFIEKPLNLYGTLQAVKSALGRESVIDAFAPFEAFEGEERSAPRKSVQLKRIAFENQGLRGRAVPQKTLRHSALLYGQGLHSGKKSGLLLEPLPANSGIHFVGVSETSIVPAHVDYVDSTGFATTLRLGRTQAGTIEHIMSALHAFGVSNLLVKCNGEVPVMDGSSRDFCSLLTDVGLEEQDGEWYEIEVRESFRVGNDSEYIQLDPADEFSVDYTLEYPEPIGMQRRVFELGDIENYIREIAPARTFGFVKDIGYLQKQGLALGGRFDNFVLIGAEGAINGELRFPDEPVRHKILDAIGDLYLLGRKIRGKVTARLTGHSDNIALLRLVREALQRAALEEK